MGKIPCAACKKSCKGQAIRLQDKYFHVKCFKCQECKKQLATGGFYSKEDSYYCGEDYQRLFGTQCARCGQYVEGEVVTALGKTYHQTCFQCTKCNKKFSAGDKVTFNGKDYLCNSCLEASSNVTTPQSATTLSSSPSKGSRPLTTSTPARPQLTSPDALTDKENVSAINGTAIMVNNHGGYRSDSDYPEQRTHDRSRDSRDSSLFDEYLTPHQGPRRRISSRLRSEEDSVFEDTDAERERLSPIQNIMQYRSPSPAASTVSRSSRKSRESSGSFRSRDEVDYGKFYNTSYMGKYTGYKTGPSLNPRIESKAKKDFHRPENFSYSKVRTDFMIPMKKESSSMMSKLGDVNNISKQKAMETAVSMDKEEPIKLSRYPDGHKPEGLWKPPIEREDWPSPPNPAAAYPELYRQMRPKRRSRGAESGAESEGEMTDGYMSTGYMSTADEVDGDDEPVPVDPKVEREIQELSKIENSGAAKVMLKDLEKQRLNPPILDPVSASRTPSADHEPHYRTRYETPIFASPSRDLDYRPRMYSVDDQLMGKKYRTATLPVGNFPVDRRGYELPKNLIRQIKAPKPGYGLHKISPRSSTAPSHRNGHGISGYMSDIDYVTKGTSHAARSFADSSLEDLSEGPSYTPRYAQSDVEEVFDPFTGLRRGGRLRGSTISDGLSTPRITSHRMSIPSVFKAEEPPQIYPYEQLKITNYKLPPGVEINRIEAHLSKEEFESIFHMPRSDFYRLAEWKRNDMKKRVGLF